MKQAGLKVAATKAPALRDTSTPAADVQGIHQTGTPEFRSALEKIVAAFVDLGFGASAAQTAAFSTKCDQKLLNIANDFKGACEMHVAKEPEHDR